jgi:Acyl-CoA synthetases (AMP-forming)/AMP-acid ligases II
VAFCRAGLAAFKRPRSVLFFEELPTTATGKLRRFAVREAATLRLATQATQVRATGPEEPRSVPV